MLEDHVDTLADVNRDGDFGSLVQELEAIVLLRRDVDGGRNLLPGHRRQWIRETVVVAKRVWKGWSGERGNAPETF